MSGSQQQRQTGDLGARGPIPGLGCCILPVAWSCETGGLKDLEKCFSPPRQSSGFPTGGSLPVTCTSGPAA